MEAERNCSDSMVCGLLDGRTCCFQLLTLSEAFHKLEHLISQVVCKQMRSLTSACVILCKMFKNAVYTTQNENILIKSPFNYLFYILIKSSFLFLSLA